VIYLGTCIVIIMVASELWIGADSRIVAISRTVEEGPTACKIYVMGNLYYASAGLLKDTAGRFDAAAVAREVSVYATSVSGAAVTFEAAIVPPLKNIILELRGENPDYFGARLLGKTALAVAFLGIEKGTPKLEVRRFVVREERGGLAVAIERQSCPGNCQNRMTWAFLGEATEVNRFLDQNPGYLGRNGFRATLQTLIAHQAEATPQYVSLPVDILKITTQGFEWIQRKYECGA
jgi:hypothetical protein